MKRFFDFGAGQADALASEEGVHLGATRAKVLDWLPSSVMGGEGRHAKASMAAVGSNLSNQVPTAPRDCHGNSVLGPVSRTRTVESS